MPIVQYARRHKNIIITPHIGAVTYEFQEMAYLRIVTGLRKWFQARI